MRITALMLPYAENFDERSSPDGGTHRKGGIWAAARDVRLKRERGEKNE